MYFFYDTASGKKKFQTPFAVDFRAFEIQIVGPQIPLKKFRPKNLDTVLHKSQKSPVPLVSLGQVFFIEKLENGRFPVATSPLVCSIPSI